MSEYKFHFHDGGRNSATRPVKDDDCAIRALALAANLPYDRAHDVLKGNVPLARVKALAALKIEKMTFPSSKGQPRMTPSAFCQKFPSGTFIVKTAKYVFVIRDGVALDVRQEPAGSCIYAAWRVGTCLAA